MSIIAKCDGKDCDRTTENVHHNIYKLSPAAAKKYNYEIEHLCEDCLKRYYDDGEIVIDNFFMEVL